MHNPLRSEADAFRWVVAIGLAAASVIALTLLTRPAVGAAWGAGLVGFGVGLLWRTSRGSLRPGLELARGGDGKHRILVVANQTVGGKALLAEIGNRARGRPAEVLVVTPALASSRAAHWASDLDEAIELARQRMELSVIAIEGTGLKVRGEVGDSDPNVAIEDALRAFPADEIVISTHPPDRSRWLEHGVVDRARSEVELPVTHVVGRPRGRAGRQGSLGRADALRHSFRTGAHRCCRLPRLQSPGRGDRPQHRQPGERRERHVEPDDPRRQLEGPLDPADGALQRQQADQDRRAGAGPVARRPGGAAAARPRSRRGRTAPPSRSAAGPSTPASRRPGSRSAGPARPRGRRHGARSRSPSCRARIVSWPSGIRPRTAQTPSRSVERPPLARLVARAPGEREGRVEQEHREDEVAASPAPARGGA